MALSALLGTGAPATLTLEIVDYVHLPVTGKLDGTGQTDGMLARVTSMREEPGGKNRFFLIDLNGPLYILDKKTRKLTTYLDFNGRLRGASASLAEARGASMSRAEAGRDARPGLFHKLAFEVGFANGLNSFQFDPDYPRNGRFYTVHIEDPALPGSAAPESAYIPALRDYTTTAPIVTPGPIQREGVLIEWTDTNTANATFEGSARELMRLQLNTRIHPIGDLAFNPTARRGDADWRVLYIAVGDGGSGESSRPDIRDHPQRLDTLVGKILRIVPDLSEHQATTTISDNGRYRVPKDNPFAAKPGARAESWAYGFRNPHRLHWAIDRSDARNNRLIANSIGLRTWETVNVVHKGANYGYSAREGNETLGLDNKTTKLPEVDKLPVRIGDGVTDELVTPAYPVAQYPHKPGGGDAVGSGYLYRGTRFPALRGKYLFTDLSTGRVWYVDYKDMLRADDGDPKTMAEMHEVPIRWDDPNDTPDAGSRVHETMFPIAQAAYQKRGGKDPNLPGRAAVSGDGRADAQFAVDADGELYIFSKSDGMIRVVVGAHF